MEFLRRPVRVSCQREPGARPTSLGRAPAGDLNQHSGRGAGSECAGDLRCHEKDPFMLDVVFILLALAVFALFALAVRGCEHL
jgi:hypothetical protein